MIDEHKKDCTFFGHWLLAAIALVPLACGDGDGPSGDDGGMQPTTGTPNDGSESDGGPANEDSATSGPNPGTEGPASSGPGSESESESESETLGGETEGDPVETDCTIDITAEVSEVIPTVGIVEWTTDATPTGAEIEFGPDTSYGMTAPVDLAEPNYRTLLLGMKPESEYHFRVVVDTAEGRCASADQTVTTGYTPNSLPQVMVTTDDADALAGGFLLAEFWRAGGPGGASGSEAFILDADGSYVWWYLFNGAASRARMSPDGKSMWIGRDNVQGGNSLVTRVSMDGLEAEDIELTDQHHDFTILPDGTVAFISHEGCDTIMERAPDGTITTVIDVSDAHGQSVMCHANSIHYVPEEDAYTVSDLNANAYVMFTRAGEVLWVFGGSTSDFAIEAGDEWNRQHGHQWLGPEGFLLFNNGTAGAPSIAIEFEIDPTNMTARRVWEYDGGHQSAVMGDVQRLPNGNTVVTYSDDGVIHEVDPNGNRVQEISFGGGGIGGGGNAVGYSIKRPTLYGPSPR